MATGPFLPFQDDYFHWAAFSPDLHFDCGAAFSELMQEIKPAAVPRSAFRTYTGADERQTMECSSSGTARVGQNIHRRLLEQLRRIPRTAEEQHSPVALSRGFRHMMRERQRREKLSQTYADLYSMLAPRSKTDKNSIVQSAAEYVRELKGLKEALQKRNEELKAQILGSNEMTKIKIRVSNPSSPIDSMIAALRCLQGMDVKAKAIRSDLSCSDFSAIMSIDTKIATSDVERAVEGTLLEVEKQLRFQLPGSSTWSPRCQVENLI